MRALTADYDVTTYAWKFNLPGCMRLWPFYFWVVSTGDTGLGLGRVNLVCVATERSLLTTSTLLQQVKNKHLLCLPPGCADHERVTLRALHTYLGQTVPLLRRACPWCKRALVVVVVVMRVMMHMALQSTSLLGGMQKRPAVQI